MVNQTMQSQKMQSKEALNIGHILRLVTVNFGLSYCFWQKKYGFLNLTIERTIVFSQVFITPRDIQYQVMGFGSRSIFRNTRIRFVPEKYKAWLDDGPDTAQFETVPNVKLHELYTNELLQEMSIAVQRNVTSPNQSEHVWQGVWYVVEKYH